MKLFAWLCIAALMVASWTPGSEMIRTGYSARLEHVGAYFIATIAVSSAYRRVNPITIALAMTAYAAALEAGQLVIPGRHADVLDWIASSTGVILGLCGVLVWFRRQNFLQ